MATSTRGLRGRSSGSSSSSSSCSSSGLCVVGSACRFANSREVVSAADNRLIKIEVDGQEITVDRYDVRLLLGDVAAFAKQNCSEEWRLAKLQESRELEDMRYEDLPRRAAFADDLPSPQQQRQWTPTLEQQQHDSRGSKSSGPMGAAARDAGHSVDGNAPDFSAVPPPDALNQSDADSAASSRPSLSPPSEHAAAAPAAAADGKDEAAAARPAQGSSHEAAASPAEMDRPSREDDQQQQQQEQQKQQQLQRSEDCFVPPFPDLPPGLRLPESLREYLVVERTAHFVREEGDRMEFRLLLDQERRLPFLAGTHRLYPFYCWLKQKGHSLVTSAGERLLPPRIKAMLTFAYSLRPKAEGQRQEQQPLESDSEKHSPPNDEEQRKQQHEQQQQQMQPVKHDPDGGLGLLLSYGSDEEEGDAPGEGEEEQQPKAKEEQEEHKQQQQQQEQQEHTKPQKEYEEAPKEQSQGVKQEQEQQQHGPEQQQQYEQQQQHQEQHQLLLPPPQENKQDVQKEPSPLPRKRPPPPPPEKAAAAEPEAGTSMEEDEESAASDGEEAISNPKDLTNIWRCQGVTRFSLKKRKKENSQREERWLAEDSSPDVEAQLAALPKPPWALPNAKLGLSKVSCLAIQQIGHHLLNVGDVSLVQHAKTASRGLGVAVVCLLQFSWLPEGLSCWGERGRYVLKCVESEIQKEGFVKPKPLPGAAHELARSFLARLQLDHHLQQRKQQLLQQCMRISEATPDDPSLDYLKTVEAAAAAAAASGKSSSSSIAGDAAEGPTEEATAASPNALSGGAPGALTAGDAAAGSYAAAAESQLPPETAAHLQMLVQQMAVASAENDVATYMACYSAYCYALAAVSPEATAAAGGPASAAAVAADAAGASSEPTHPA
ncbi:hypothetical protein Efla_006266 [Eimeria flavescens]